MLSKPIAPLMSAAEVTEFLRVAFPQANAQAQTLYVEDVGVMTCRMRMIYHPRHLRPGGTISGPAMFALADVALYLAIIAQIGPVALAVTTNMNINFLSKPGPVDLLADCRLFKLGKRLAVGEVSLFSEGSPNIVAHATGTYSIPPRS